MRTISRYVAGRFLRAFLASLAILTLVLLVVDMLLQLDDILEAQRGPWGAVRFIVLRTTAEFLPYLVPAATFAGAFLAIGLAARSREILAMKAGGISPLRALLPVFAAAAAIALTAGVLNETLARRAKAALQGSADGEETRISLRSGTIWYHSGRNIYNIREAHPESETVEGVRVFERNADGRLVRVVHGQFAVREEAGLWRFRNVTVRRFDPSRPAKAPEVERAESLTLELRGDRSARLLQAELTTLPLPSLARYVAEVEGDGPGAARARAMLHDRLSDPLLALLFALFAAPLALRVEQTRSLAVPALQGVLLLFVFLSLREYGPDLALWTGASSAAVCWGTIGAFFLWSGWSLARVPR